MSSNVNESNVINFGLYFCSQCGSLEDRIKELEKEITSLKLESQNLTNENISLLKLLEEYKSKEEEEKNKILKGTKERERTSKDYESFCKQNNLNLENKESLSSFLEKNEAKNNSEVIIRKRNIIEKGFKIKSNYIPKPKTKDLPLITKNSHKVYVALRGLGIKNNDIANLKFSNINEEEKFITNNDKTYKLNKTLIKDLQKLKGKKDEEEYLFQCGEGNQHQRGKTLSMKMILEFKKNYKVAPKDYLIKVKNFKLKTDTESKPIAIELPKNDSSINNTSLDCSRFFNQFLCFIKTNFNNIVSKYNLKIFIPSSDPQNIEKTKLSYFKTLIERNIKLCEEVYFDPKFFPYLDVEKLPNAEQNTINVFLEMKKNFFNCKYPPIEIKLCEDIQKGLGIFALEIILANTILFEYTGELTFEENIKDSDFDGFFNLVNNLQNKNKNIVIDPRVRGNMSKFLNGVLRDENNKVSKEEREKQNCTAVRIKINNFPHIIIHTIKEIQIGEELIYDYGKNYGMKDEVIEERNESINEEESNNYQMSLDE